MGEKITSQLQEILNRLTSVETRLQKIEGLCEKITNLEKAVNKTQAELNSLHEMADITNKKVIKEANSIKYDFIWKGKDKVKRSSLISDIEHGGLKAPHLESIIKTQRILCCKKFASDQLSAWKTFLLHYLKPIGGKFILCCDFDMNKRPINLPKYYKEYVKNVCNALQNVRELDKVTTILHTKIYLKQLYGTISLSVSMASLSATKILLVKRNN